MIEKGRPWVMNRDTNYQLTYAIKWILKCMRNFMWRCCYFANGLNMQKIMKFLMCASNIYTICNWETDQCLELFRGIQTLFKEKSNSNKRNQKNSSKKQ